MTEELWIEANNQLTLPDAIVVAAAIVEGDRFIVGMAGDDTDTLLLQRIRPSYAGALKDALDDPERALEAERSSWSERERP